MAKSPNLFEQLIPFVFFIAIFYFLIFRPQQKRTKGHQEFLLKLQRGDSVLTSSGIMGTIEGLSEKFVTLEIASGVRIKLLRNQVASAMDEVQK